MIIFKKQRVSFSPKALNEQKLALLAGNAVETPGAIVGCGAIPKSHASYLANVGLACHRDFYMSDASHITPRESCATEGTAKAILGALQERGYSCHHLNLDQPMTAPQEISFLYISGSDLAFTREILNRLNPFLVSGSTTVVEGLGDDRSGIPELLDTLGVKITEEEPCVEEGLIWWVKAPASDSIPEPTDTSIAGASTADTSAAEPPRPDEFVVLSTPQIPRGKFASMCEMAGYRTTNDITVAFDIAIKWFGETFTPGGDILRELASVTHVINSGCDDISKIHVEAIHQAVFGYGLIVDPTTYVGPAVMKANLNAQCRESVVTCPVAEAVPGFVYQRLIVTRPEPEEFEEYRVPITGSEIPCVVIKRRPVAQRFDRTAGYAELTSATDVFNAEEIDLLHELCRRVGLEFGDLDVLRDRSDQRIHVIDANPTPGGPGGPGGGYTAKQRKELLTIQLEALNRYFFQVLEGNGPVDRRAHAVPERSTDHGSD